VLFGERRKEVQHERFSVGTKLGNDERDFMPHKAADVIYVTAQSIELCHDDRSASLAGRFKGRRKLGSMVVVALPLSVSENV
jgi:hypothetical protein